MTKMKWPHGKLISHWSIAEVGCLLWSQGYIYGRVSQLLEADRQKLLFVNQGDVRFQVGVRTNL
jgi:hypothetical protein